MTDGSRSRPGALWLLAIVLVAVNLRPVITSVPPLVDALSAGFGLSAVAAGALTTLPVICMGVLAPIAPVAARRFGDMAVMAGAVGLIALGAAGRAVGGAPCLYIATAVAGAGIAVAGTMLPSLVRSAAPDRVAPLTGLYTAALIAGAFVAAGATEPLRDALGASAQAVLAVWAVPAVIALAVWLTATPNSADHEPQVMIGAISRPPAHDRRDLGGPWRSRAAWLGTIFMGMQALLFYAALAWLAATYTDLGLSARSAGLLLGVFSATQIVTALAMPALAHRTGRLRPWIVLSMGLVSLGFLFVALMPMASPWLWAALLGLGMGGNLALALTLLTQMAPTAQAASAYAGMAFFVGYLLAAAGPVAAGALRDATGRFTAVYLTLAALGVVTLAVGLAAARHTDYS